MPTASIVIPTRSRAHYLEVTLASVSAQAARAGAELIVINDGGDPAAAAVAARHRAHCVPVAPAKGANAARNLGLKQAKSDLVILIDDDVEAPPEWLAALLAGARDAPDREVFGGPIRARLEGFHLRVCGRESAPITTLDLGPVDRDVPFVWSANLAIRRGAFERIGEFDEGLAVRGDEEDWERRFRASGGQIRYLASAALYHRRAAPDTTLRTLSRAAYGQGRAARRNDLHKDEVPSLRRELRILAGCIWHTARRRCAFGVVMAAHSAGRIRQAMAG